MTQQEKQDLLNQMWRNPCLNDTYEPGSTFKIITMSAGLEAGVVSVNDRFYCPGYKVVDDLAGSTVPEGRGTAPRILWKGHRTPATRYLSR